MKGWSSNKGHEGCWAGKEYVAMMEVAEVGRRCPEERPLMQGW